MSERLQRFLLGHTPELRKLAELGCVLSVALIALRPGRLALPAMLCLAGGLFYVGKKLADPDVIDNRDWLAVPETARIILERASQIFPPIFSAASILMVAGYFLGWTASPLIRWLVDAAVFAALAAVFALEALFFRYGAMKHQD